MRDVDVEFLKGEEEGEGEEDNFLRMLSHDVVPAVDGHHMIHTHINYYLKSIKTYKNNICTESTNLQYPNYPPL